MITARARSWCWLALAVTITSLACAERRPRALLTIRVELAVYRPEFVLLTWRSPAAHERANVRVPQTGVLPRIGTELATVYVDLDPGRPGERQVLVRGMRGGQQVSVGSARFDWQGVEQPAVTVTLGCFEDPGAPGGGTCPFTPPSPDGGAETPPDALPTDGEIPPADAGLPDAPAVPDGSLLADAAPDAAADAARPIDRPIDLPADLSPPPPDAASAPDVPAAAPDGPAPVDAPILPPPGVNLTTGLVLYFKLDDDPTSGTAKDSSGNANLGLLSNLQPAKAWVPGRSGRGIELPGGDVPGWIPVKSSSSLNLISGALTISVWVRASPDPGEGRSTIVMRAASAGGVLYSLHLLGDRPAFWLNSSQGANGIGISSSRLKPDQWVHLALVFDGMRARLHADGRVVAEAMHELPFAPEISPLMIGGRPGGGIPAIDTYAGQLDEIAVYDRALSAAEVQALADGFQPAVP